MYFPPFPMKQKGSRKINDFFGFLTFSSELLIKQSEDARDPEKSTFLPETPSKKT